MNDRDPASAAKGEAAVLEARGLLKTFRQGPLEVEVLKGIDFRIAAGERYAIVGASGSGKSTLLHCLGGLERPSTGSLTWLGEDVGRLSEVRRGLMRNRHLGFVYQFHHLLPEFSAQENVAMPLLIRRLKKEEAMTQAADLLDRVGLGERLDHKPGELSGGERQRAAVARALITRPKLVLADEPTGNLDAGNGAHVLRLMLELNEELRTSLVIVTHDHSIAEQMDRVVVLENGRLVEKSR